MSINANFLCSLAGDLAYCEPEVYGWLGERSLNYPIHAMIVAAIETSYIEMPTQVIQTVVREWPHVSNGDPLRIAYYRDPQAGSVSKATTCKLGAYLARVFPHLTGAQVETLVQDYRLSVGQSQAVPADSYEILTDDAMISALMAVREAGCYGPRSCMTEYDCARYHDSHPCRVYSSDLGWAMVVRRTPAGNIAARAMTYCDSEGGRTYTRLYGTPGDCGGFANPEDGPLRAWLRSNGYVHVPAYPDGAKIAIIEHPRRYQSILMPWIDGDRCMVSADTGLLLMPGDSGTALCGQVTTGYAEVRDMVETSSGEHYPESECVQLPNGDWELESECVETINGDWALRDDCVYLHGGEYALAHDCVRVNREWYLADDEAIVYLENADRYVMAEDAVTLYDGDHALLEDAVYIESMGEYALIFDCVELLDGDWALKEDAVRLHDGSWALSEDAVELHDGTFALTDDAVELHDGTFALIDDAVKLHDGNWALEEDVLTLDTGKYALVSDAVFNTNRGVWILAETQEEAPAC